MLDNGAEKRVHFIISSIGNGVRPSLPGGGIDCLIFHLPNRNIRVILSTTFFL